jgi:hypothetical protein
VNYPPSIQPNTKNTAAPVKPDIELLARFVALRIIEDPKDRPHLRRLFLSELDRALDNDYNDRFLIPPNLTVLLSPNVLYQIFQISSVTFYSSVSWASAFVSPTLSPIPLEFPHVLHSILFPRIMASQDASQEVISFLSDDEESKS